MSVTTCWLLDASTFINALTVGHVRTLIALRAPLLVPEYVYQLELAGPSAKPDTRAEAERCKASGGFQVYRLTLADVRRMAAMDPPKRKVGIGELSCALIAERANGGVLSDDHKSRSWIEQRVRIVDWQSIEDVLLAAAHASYVSEYELDDCEHKLLGGKYTCRVSLRNTFLMQRLSRSGANSR
jgi:hypothetical protein